MPLEILGIIFSKSKQHLFHRKLVLFFFFLTQKSWFSLTVFFFMQISLFPLKFIGSLSLIRSYYKIYRRDIVLRRHPVLFPSDPVVFYTSVRRIARLANLAWNHSLCKEIDDRWCTKEDNESRTLTQFMKELRGFSRCCTPCKDQVHNRRYDRTFIFLYSRLFFPLSLGQETLKVLNDSCKLLCDREFITSYGRFHCCSLLYLTYLVPKKSHFCFSWFDTEDSRGTSGFFFCLRV